MFEGGPCGTSLSAHANLDSCYTMFTGSGVCPPCATGLKCLVSGDCNSTLCYQYRCVEELPGPKCNDRIRNGNETDVDCGGACFV